MIIRDAREVGRTELDARGNYLAPSSSVRIASIPQVDGTTRRIYAHTRAEARTLRAALRDDPALIDGLSSDQVALILGA